MHVKYFFDKATGTLTYIISDCDTGKCAIIDPVLDYDQNTGRVTTNSVDQILNYVKKQNLTVEWLLESHVHADHLTASYHLKHLFSTGKIAIGERVLEVLDHWVPIFNTYQDTPIDGRQFDHLWKDGEVFKIGNITTTVLCTPGHTPACVCYYMNDCIFVGDTLFSPELGTARADFPGGNAQQLYYSIQKILSLPEDTKVFVGHDYPNQGNSVNYMSTVKQQKMENVMISKRTDKQSYIALRNSRDSKLPTPRLLLPSIQVNLRAGRLGTKDDNNRQYLKIPINLM